MTDEPIPTSAPQEAIAAELAEAAKRYPAVGDRVVYYMHKEDQDAPEGVPCVITVCWGGGVVNLRPDVAEGETYTSVPFSEAPQAGCWTW